MNYRSKALLLALFVLHCVNSYANSGVILSDAVRALIVETRIGSELGIGKIGRELGSRADIDEFVSSLTRDEATSFMSRVRAIEGELAARGGTNAVREQLAEHFLSRETQGGLSFVERPAGEAFTGTRNAFLAGELPTYTRLKPVEIVKLRAGEQIYHEEAVSGSHWPKVSVYNRVAGSSPENVAHVFTDATTILKTMRGRLAKVQLIPGGTKLDYDVAFELNIPTGNVKYTLRHHVKQTPNGYRVDWKLIDGTQSSSVKDIEGYGLFEADGDGTMVTYHHFVTPNGGLFARAVRSLAVNGVKETAALLSEAAAVELKTNLTGYAARVREFASRF